MEDVLLEQFLQGDPRVIRQLRPIVQDFVMKNGGGPDDAREVFQIVSLAIFERSKRSLARHLGKAFKTWLNKRRKDPPYVAGQVRLLELALDRAFAGHPGLKPALRQQDEDAARQFNKIAVAVLEPFVQAEEGEQAEIDGIIATALEKIQRVILDFKDYFLKSCKNEWLRLKKKRGMISSEEAITHLAVEEHDDSTLHEQKNLILNLLQKASEACRNLLHQLFIEGKTKEELLSVLGYSNPNSFDVAKSRCLSALRTTVKQHPNLNQPKT